MYALEAPVVGSGECAGHGLDGDRTAAASRSHPGVVACVALCLDGLHTG